METWGVIVTVILIGAVGCFALISMLAFFDAPILVNEEKMIVRIKDDWSTKVDGGYYRLEKMERNILFTYPLVTYPLEREKSE